jgi:hypothetical protein
MRLMVSLAVEQRRTLKQGDCKNAFCQGILPDDEITIVKPPIGGTLMPPKTNIGFSGKHFTVYVGVPVTGTPRSRPYYKVSASRPTHQTPACSPAAFATPTIPPMTSHLLP